MNNSNKNSIIPEEMAIRMYLSYRIDNLKINKKMYHSVLNAALRDSRRITGRDILSGRKNINNPAIVGCWLGIMGYFSVLEQIGKCFINMNKSIKSNGNDIIWALKNFSGMQDDESYALYALRCALSHEFSLFNLPNQSHKNYDLLIHRFTLTTGNDNPLITFPTIKWNGNYGTNTHNDDTVVNVEKFCDLVENIYIELCSLFDEGKLSLKLPGGSDELLQRFSFGIFNKE